jgi:DNA-binding MarR family transcriptional regulator
VTSTPSARPARADSVDRAHDRSLEDDLDVVLRGSRVMTSVVAASLARTDDVVTMLQLRVLVLAATRPGTTATSVAEELGVHVSSASRTVDRLAASGFVQRRESTEDRRRLELVPTTEGRELIETLMADRRRALRELMRAMSAEDRAHLARGMRALADAAGEPPGPSPLIP